MDGKERANPFTAAVRVDGQLCTVSAPAMSEHRSRFRDADGEAASTHHPDADVDVAGWFGRCLATWDVNLLMLDTAGLELGGRIAQHGLLLLHNDPLARVV